jgi:hypothetical protein
MSENVETKIAVHEAICSERYKNIEDKLSSGSQRMTRIEYLLYIVIAAVLLGPGFLADIIRKLAGV